MNDRSHHKGDSGSVLPASRRRRRLFYFLAPILGIAPFIALEAGLRLFEIGEDAATTDVHAGFGDAAPLFVLDEDKQNFTTGLGREQFFVTQSFEAEKPDRQFRIFCIGGSTVQGRPYLPDTAFSAWLELELNAIDDSKDYRVVNCGGISYASYRLRPLVEEVVNYAPDLIVVATGHNEFLEDKTYAEVKSRSAARIWIENSARSLRSVMLLRKLVGGAPRVEPTTETVASADSLDTRLDDPSGYASYHRDDQWHDEVCLQFKESVGAIADSCRSADVPLIFVQLGANLRDCPPFKSEHREDLTVDEEQRWQELFDAAPNEGDTQTQLDLYLQALSIDDHYPLLHFRTARCYDTLRQFDKARQHYQKSLDLDVCPLRKCGRLGQLLSGIAKEKEVPIVDAETVVSESSPENICGYESYIDHVHPTIAVHQIIAQQIVMAARRTGVVSASEQLSAQKRRQRYRDYITTDLPTNYYSNGRRRIGWLEGWAQRQRLSEETIPTDTRGRVALTIRNIDLHRFAEAKANISNALVHDEAAGELLVEASFSYFKQGRNYESRWILQDLEGRKISDSLNQKIQLGRLVLACDSVNQNEVRRIHALYAEQWQEIISEDRSKWTKAISNLPDVVAAILASS